MAVQPFIYHEDPCRVVEVAQGSHGSVNLRMTDRVGSIDLLEWP